MDPILSLLENNCMYTNKELAAMLGRSEAEVAEKIEEYKASGVIVGCQAADVRALFGNIHYFVSFIHLFHLPY